MAFGARLSSLAGPDAYRLGDVCRRVLRNLQVPLPIEERLRNRASAALGEHLADRIAERGLTGVLVADGLAPIPSVRERLLAVARSSLVGEPSFDKSLRAFRADAARARQQELDWLARALQVRLGATDLDDSRSHVAAIWFG